MNEQITVVIPTIPPRAALLARAVQSAANQSLPAAALSVAVDNQHAGAAHTRQRALDAVKTGWTAFLDDDDEFMPHHLEQLHKFAHATDADYVYSWFRVVGANGRVMSHDPVFPESHFLEPFDPNNPIQTTITVLVKTELAKHVGFWKPDDEREVDGQRWGEDYSFTLDCVRAGARITHLVEHTWYWHHDSGNTSGRGDRW